MGEFEQAIRRLEGEYGPPNVRPRPDEGTVEIFGVALLRNVDVVDFANQRKRGRYTGCPLCEDAEGIATRRGLGSRDAVEIVCRRCGRFEIARTALVGLAEESKLALAAYCRHATTFDGSVTKLSTGNIQGFAASRAGRTVLMRADSLLRYIGQLSGQPGTIVEINPSFERPIVDGADDNAVPFFLRHWSGLGVIDWHQQNNWALTMKGWETLGQLGLGTPKTVFVAMAFAEDMKPVFDEGIEPAIRECGLDPRRMDRIRIEAEQKICDMVIAEIRACQIVIVDCTLPRCDVYYEAGFAAALGKIVIRTCRGDRINEVAFDTRQYSHIKWKDPEDLRIQLVDRIRALVPNLEKR